MSTTTLLALFAVNLLRLFLHRTQAAIGRERDPIAGNPSAALLLVYALLPLLLGRGSTTTTVP